MSDPCPHDGPRERGAVPLICSVCGGVEIARAPHSRCARCKGDGRRDPGWETSGPQWLSVVRPHLESGGHQARAPPPYLELPDAPLSASVHTPPPRFIERTGTPSSGYESPLVRSSVSARPGDNVTERAMSPVCAGGGVAPARPRLTRTGTAPDTVRTAPIRPPPPLSLASSGGGDPAAASPDRSSAWSGAERTPCFKCGLPVRRDNLSRHLKRCAPDRGTSA